MRISLMTLVDADKSNRIREDQHDPRHPRSMIFLALACPGWDYK
jgi:hypothetical protein